MFFLNFTKLIFDSDSNKKNKNNDNNNKNKNKNAVIIENKIIDNELNNVYNNNGVVSQITRKNAEEKEIKNKNIAIKVSKVFIITATNFIPVLFIFEKKIVFDII